MSFAHRWWSTGSAPVGAASAPCAGGVVGGETELTGKAETHRAEKPRRHTPSVEAQRERMMSGATVPPEHRRGSSLHGGARGVSREFLTAANLEGRAGHPTVLPGSSEGREDGVEVR